MSALNSISNTSWSGSARSYSNSSFNQDSQITVVTLPSDTSIAINSKQQVIIDEMKKAEQFNNIDALKIACGVDFIGQTLMTFIINAVEPTRSFTSWCSSMATSIGIIPYWILTLGSRELFKPISEKFSQILFPHLPIDYLKDKIVPQVQAFLGLLTGLITSAFVISPARGKLEKVLERMPIMRQIARLTGLKNWQKESNDTKAERTKGLGFISQKTKGGLEGARHLNQWASLPV